MEKQYQHRYLSGKSAREILNVSDNTLRRWANTGKINYIRNSEKGKRFYDIYSIINENKIINQQTALANNTKKLSKNDSDVDLYSKSLNQLSKLDINTHFNIIDKPLDKIKNTVDDTSIDYNYNDDFLKNYKKNHTDVSNIYCYCKVNKTSQEDILEEQINKLKQLYSNSEIISCVSTNDMNWKKNKILKLINNMKENKIKELVINKSEYISDKLIDLITDLCLIYNIKVIKI